MSETIIVGEGGKIPRRSILKTADNGTAVIELSERIPAKTANEAFHCPNKCPLPDAQSLPKRRGRKVETALAWVGGDSQRAIVLMACYNCGESFVKREKKDSADASSDSDN